MMEINTSSKYEPLFGLLAESPETESAQYDAVAPAATSKPEPVTNATLSKWIQLKEFFFR